jgi:hypothetical protein
MNKAWIKTFVEDSFYAKATMIASSLKGESDDKWIILKKDFNLFAETIAVIIMRKIRRREVKRNEKSKRVC